MNDDLKYLNDLLIYYQNFENKKLTKKELQKMKTDFSNIVNNFNAENKELIFPALKVLERMFYNLTQELEKS